MIYRGFLDSSALVPNARKGKPANWAKNRRLAMLISPELAFARGSLLYFPSFSGVKSPMGYSIVDAGCP
jgi:hypothetical protein